LTAAFKLGLIVCVLVLFQAGCISLNSATTVPIERMSLEAGQAWSAEGTAQSPSAHDPEPEGSR